MTAAKAKRRGRPRHGPTLAKELPQLSIRLTPDIAKRWNRLQQENPYHTQHDLLALLLEKKYGR